MVCTVQTGVWLLLANLQLHTFVGDQLISAEESLLSSPTVEHAAG